MKNISRIVACLLACLMMLSIVACSSNTTTTTTPAPSTTEEAKSTTAAETKASETTAAPTTETPTTAAPTTEAPTTPDPTTATPTETPVDGPKELVHPEINETFGTSENPKQIKFFINGGESAWDSVFVRSIALVADENGDMPDMTYAPNQMTQKRNDQIKSEIGTEIVVAGVGTMQGTVNELKPLLAAQEYVYDVLGLYQYFDFGLALTDTVGSFYNYENMPEDYTNYLNIDAPYWNKSLYDTIKLRDPDSGNSVAFFLTGDLTQTNTGNMFVSFINQRIWNDYKEEIAKLESSGGYSDIYDIINNGYWTLEFWSDLANLCWQDTNASGSADKDDQLGVLVYGSAANLNNMSVEYFSYGSRVMYTGLDDRGTPVATFNSDHNLDFFRKLYHLFCETNIGAMPWIDGEGEFLMDYFARGNVLACVNELRCTEEYLTEMTDDYWVMPLPMKDRDQYNPKSASLGYATGLGDSLTQFAIVVYGGDERIPAITATLELMGYYSKLWVTPAYYDVALKTRFVRDEQNAAMIDTIHEGIYSCFGLVWSHHLGDVTFWVRTEYDKINSLANTSKVQQKSLRGYLNKLLTNIYTAWFVTY